MVEQSPEKACVGGSIPSLATTSTPTFELDISDLNLFKGILLWLFTTIYKQIRNEYMSLKGKVKWFNGKKGYGFIEREDKEKDVFVHHTAVREAGLKYLNEGDELTFEVENGEKGPSAVKLQKA